MRSIKRDPVDAEVVVERWFRQYADTVLAYLLHRTDADTAHDILQETFLVAMAQADEVPEPPVGWLLLTSRRLLSNRDRGARRRNRLVERFGATIDPADELRRVEEVELVRSVLTRLSARDQEILTVATWYDLTPDEAARTLGCAVGTFRVRLHRARRRFAAVLAEVQGTTFKEVGT